MTPIEKLDTRRLAELGRPDPSEVANNIYDILESEAKQRLEESVRFYDFGQDKIGFSDIFLIITLKNKEEETITKSLLPVVRRQDTDYAIDQDGFLYQIIDDDYEKCIRLSLWSEPTEKDYIDNGEQEIVKKGTILPISKVLKDGKGYETIPLTEEMGDTVFQTESYKIIADFQIPPQMPSSESEFRKGLEEYINKFREFYSAV